MAWKPPPIREPIQQGNTISRVWSRWFNTVLGKFVQALGSLTTDGFLVKSGSDAHTRKLTSPAGNITVTNADGTGGDPGLNVISDYLYARVSGVAGEIDITDLGSEKIQIGISSLFTLDHGNLTGLGDDDHLQYHTDARADTWLANGHETTYVHDDIALNTTHRNTTSGNPHSVASSDLTAGGTPQSGTYTFGGGATGDVQDMTFENGILTGVTLVP